jgi:hypothetical protein
MARGRLISRSLGSSRKFHDLLRVGGKLGEFCQVLYPLIVTNTDDWGRMAGDAFTIKNVVLPTSARKEADFEQALQAIHEVGLIARYVVSGDIYLQVLQFDAHQVNLHKRNPSKFPESPVETPENPEDSGKVRLNLTELKRTESKRTEPRTLVRVADTLFDLFWAAYPKKKAKDQARKEWDKRRPDHALLDTMLAAIRVQARSADWIREGGRFIPHPSTWLHQARWTDVETSLPHLNDATIAAVRATEEFLQS